MEYLPLPNLELETCSADLELCSIPSASLRNSGSSVVAIKSIKLLLKPKSEYTLREYLIADLESLPSKASIFPSSKPASLELNSPFLASTGRPTVSTIMQGLLKPFQE
ncbi:hypothetical protein V8G54_023117 [Vigna mungo]|uniref:Uncharacterized protein n=1 Tax=Vigna mungo TaxID=3915 RepID=A0AAQ3RS92_VIGMU